jgi:hypothetical protein
MGFAGQIAQGANDELAELFRRQMVEAQQQEQQRQVNARLLQDRAEMAQRGRLADTELAQRGRIADTEQTQRQHVIDRQDASELAQNLSPGEITGEQASALGKSPVTASRVTRRQTLPATAMPGTAPLDESGPKDYSVLEPTPQQARQQGQDSERRRIIAGLSPRGRQASEMSDVGVPAAVIANEMSDPAAEDARAIRLAGGMAEVREAANARHRAPAAPPRTELTPGQAFSATRQLRNDFVRETAAARTVTQQLGLMKSSLAAAEKGDMAAGSQGVLVTFQKILDPNSVVRESEYARSASGQALLSRIEGAAAKLTQGGAGIPLSELRAFVSLGEQFVKNQSVAANEAKEQIDAIAQEFGLNPDRITREFGDGAPDAGGQQAMQKEIPGIPGSLAESTDGGKTWRRVK